MAKKWEQILQESGKVSPERLMHDRAEMLEELGMTWAQFKATEEYRKSRNELADKRFWQPTGKAAEK